MQNQQLLKNGDDQMLKETYVANLKNIPKDAIREYVNNYNRLAPSIALKIRAGIWKDPATGQKRTPKMQFDEYAALYKQELLADNFKIAVMRTLRSAAETADVYLICYCKEKRKCHRSILLNMIALIKPFPKEDDD
jgi:uncharacterized protein YeaO (DUF488 family)